MATFTEFEYELLKQLESVNKGLDAMNKRLDWIAFTEQQKHFNSYQEYQTHCRNCKKRMRFDYIKLDEVTPDDMVQQTCPGCKKSKG